MRGAGRLTGEGSGRLFRPDGWPVKIALVMAGGSLGALSRYAVSAFATHLLGNRFPWGTLIVNLSGCFLIGLAVSLADRGLRIMSPSVRLLFMTGFLGALTTFSMYALETVDALRGHALLIAAAHGAVNNLLGIALVFLGMWIGRLK